MQKVAISPAVQAAADRAIFGMQLGSVSAAKFVQTEVPGVTIEDALAAIRVTARPNKRK